MTTSIRPDSEAGIDAEVTIIGAGPAGLSAALNLARARVSVVVIDEGRPRNAATLRSHGFLTRDGVPPLELRKLARAELAAYPGVRVLDRAVVTGVATRETAGGPRFSVALRGRQGTPRVVSARSVVVCTGLRETLPAIPSLRAYYGITMFSCAACDAYEVQDRPLALIGETADLGARARLIARWTDRLTVFTNGAPIIDTVEEAELAVAGVAVDRRTVADLEGERGAVAGVRLTDGDVIPIDGGFVRPRWSPSLEFLSDVDIDRDEAGHLVIDRSGRTSVPGIYAAGDAAAPGPQQLIVAAGQGARVAAVLVHDLIGVTTSH